MANRKRNAPSSATLLTVLSQLPVFLALLDRERRHVWCNRYAYGYSADTVVGTRGEDAINENDRPLWINHATHVLDLGETCSGICRNHSGVRMAYRMCPWKTGKRIVGIVVAAWNAAIQGEQSITKFLLTPTSKRIVDFLRDNGPAKGATIGKYLGETCTKGQATSSLRIIIHSLEERGVLVHSSNGYDVSPEFLALLV